MWKSSSTTLTRVASKAYPRASSSSLAWRAFSSSTPPLPESSVLLTQLQKIQEDNAQSTVPWFLNQMPKSYFRAIDGPEQLQHLNAITSLRYAQQPELMLQSPCGKIFSFIQQKRSTEQHKPSSGLLSLIMKQLPNQIDDPEAEGGSANLARVKIFTSRDDSLALDVFRYGVQPPFRGEDVAEAEAADRFLSYCRDIQEGKFASAPEHPSPNDYFEPDQVQAFLQNCNAMHVKHSSPRRLASQMLLYHQVKGTENVALEIEHGWESKTDIRETKLFGGEVPQHMITIASANVLPKNSLEKAAKYLALSKLNVVRAHLDVIEDPGHGKVVLNRILVSPMTCLDNETSSSVDWDEISHSLKYLKWVDDRVLDLASQHSASYPNLTLHRAEIIIALGNLLHGVLAKVDPFAYALGRIFSCLESNLDLAIDIARVFELKFDPEGQQLSSPENFERDVKKVEADIRRNVEPEDEILLFQKMLEAVRATLRTNRFVEDRFALALRLEPTFMGIGSVASANSSLSAQPFGTFFIHGRRFNGFHVRFRDISRGGLRVVAPNTTSEHRFESSRQYTEAFNLAYAQQLKNKDIAEGGSKAVILVEPSNTEARDFVIRKSVKAFADALLDLNSTDEAVRRKIVDYYGHDELIYLGPDENIVPSDILWVTRQAQLRGYPIPRAFMSSKPDVGINHKVYGVTSEGVAVFVQVGLNALLASESDPERPFTVKMTGGTDGDVAGNMIKILHRDYGTRVKIVGICDGTAVIENPTSGISMTELLRLVDHELPLSSFNASLDDPSTSCLLADHPEGIRQRNSMHHRISADVFLPAGGRPSTINANNFRDFLRPVALANGKSDEGGSPPRNGNPGGAPPHPTPTDWVGSSPLIVEGANLFITPEARQLLFDHAGVVVVKDSSANKCGVICSSVEIMASMLLDAQEFLDVKDDLVADVLIQLRALARVEAELLFREYARDSNEALPLVSERISANIIRLHDAIATSLSTSMSTTEDVQKHEALMKLIKNHLPTSLNSVAGDRILSRVPLSYVHAMAAAALASRIVYREGLRYCESLGEQELAQVALEYLEREGQVEGYVEEIRLSGCDHAEEIAELMAKAGTRAALEKM